MIAAMASPVATFAEHCARGELAYTVDAAGTPVWPPRTGLAWRVGAGVGTVYATTTIRPRGGVPRNVAIVELDEGYRMMASVDATAVVIGMRVAVRFDGGVPVFR